MSTYTSYPQSIFTLPLLQAINDWHISSSGRRATKIERLSNNLPSYFKECQLTCFRKVDLENKFTANLLLDCMEEKISSWTYSIDTAKTFKHGVPPKDKGQGVILCITPTPSQVILNLTRLYQDQGFVSAIRANRKRIKNFHKGIDRYWHSQDEVILKVESISTHDVYSLGGYSSTPEQLVWLATSLSGLPMSIVYSYLSYRSGAHWLSHEGTQRVLDRMYSKVMSYRNVIRKPS